MADWLSTRNYQCLNSTQAYSHAIVLENTQIGIFPLATLLRAAFVDNTILGRHGPHYLAATNPLDKIFPLLGHAVDRKESEGLGVFLDSTTSSEQTYTIAMATMLK
jgi:hypothetical protein